MKRFSTAISTLALLSVCVLFLGCESDLDKANALAKAGKRELATKMYDKVLKTDKKSIPAWMGLAALHCSPGSYNGFRCLGAAEALEKLKAKDPKVKGWLKRALYSSAYDRTTSGELMKAEKYLKRYLALEPSDAKAYFIGAMIKERQGKKPFDPSELREAIKHIDKVLKMASKGDTIKMNPKDKNLTPLKWEAAKMKGNILDSILADARSKFLKSAAGKKKGAAFKANEADFKAGVAAFAMANSLNATQPDKSLRFYPMFQTAMMHVNFKSDFDGALGVLMKAEKSFPKSRNILVAIYQLHMRKMKGVKGRGRRARKKRKALKKIADAYLAKVANLPKPRPKPRK